MMPSIDQLMAVINDYAHGASDPVKVRASIESALSAARAEERGRCAKVCHELDLPDGVSPYEPWAVGFASGTYACEDAISALKDQPK